MSRRSHCSSKKANSHCSSNEASSHCSSNKANKASSHCSSNKANLHGPGSYKEAVWQFAIVSSVFPYEKVRPEVHGLNKKFYGTLLPLYGDFTTEEFKTAAELVAAMLGENTVRELGIIFIDRSIVSTLYSVLEAHNMSFDQLSSAPSRAKQKYLELRKQWKEIERNQPYTQSKQHTNLLKWKFLKRQQQEYFQKLEMKKTDQPALDRNIDYQHFARPPANHRTTSAPAPHMGHRDKRI